MFILELYKSGKLIVELNFNNLDLVHNYLVLFFGALSNKTISIFTYKIRGYCL